MEPIFSILVNRTDVEKAEIAAEILSDCDPNREVMFKFIDVLDDSVREVLYSRLNEYYMN